MKKKYYMFKMNMNFMNLVSIILIVLSLFVFYLIYGKSSFSVLRSIYNPLILLYLPYLIFHELLHSLAYVIYGADFKKITYGVHLEKGVLCCLCKQNITKKNILHSLLYPFVFIGIITLIIGIIINNPLLVLLSLANISGCSGDLVMFYHLVKLKNYEFSEYDDPTSFGIYTKEDLSKKKMLGLDFIDSRSKLDRKDFKKINISKTSVILLIGFYVLLILTLII